MGVCGLYPWTSAFLWCPAFSAYSPAFNQHHQWNFHPSERSCHWSPRPVSPTAYGSIPQAWELARKIPKYSSDQVSLGSPGNFHPKYNMIKTILILKATHPQNRPERMRQVYTLSYGTISEKAGEVIKKQAANIAVEARLHGLCGANSQHKGCSPFPP